MLCDKDVNEMDEIGQVSETEIRNYEISCSKYRESVQLIQKLVNLYQKFGDFIQESKLPASDEVLSLSQYLLACRYQLVIGALSILRGHLNDSFIFARKAIEHCAFAARVVKHPHLATIWVKAGDNDESYKKYREKFSPGKIFPDDHQALGELYNRYDLCAKFSHPSIYSFAGHLGTNIHREKIQFTMEYFQLRNNDPSEPIRTLLWTIDTHSKILNVFLEQLSKFNKFTKNKAAKSLLAFQQVMAIEKDKYASVISIT